MDVVDRPALDGARAVKMDASFDGYVRSGQVVEMKAFTGVTGEAGGYAVPREIDAVIDRTLVAASPIRAIANVVKVGSAGYRKLVTTGGTPSGWAAETEARPGTASPVFAEIAPPSGELYANPSASQAMLDDAAFDVEAWLAGEIGTEFARAEGAAFINGNGINRPRGFLSSPATTASDATRPFGTLQYLPTGAAGDFGAAPQEKLIDLVQALRAPYRQGASFVMNAATLARIRKFKTSDGAFMWQPSLSAAVPARGGARVCRHRGRSGAGAAVPGGRALVVDHAGWAALPVRCGGSGGIRAGAGSERAGYAVGGAEGDAGSGGWVPGGIDRGAGRGGEGARAGVRHAPARIPADGAGPGGARDAAGQSAGGVGGAGLRRAATGRL